MPSTGEGDRMSVLIVEDEALVRQDIAQVLRSVGWYVLEADTAELALELLREHRPSVVSRISVSVVASMAGTWDRHAETSASRSFMRRAEPKTSGGLLPVAFSSLSPTRTG